MENRKFGWETLIAAFLLGVIVGIVGFALFPTQRNNDARVASATDARVNTSGRAAEPGGMETAAPTSGGWGFAAGPRW